MRKDILLLTFFFVLFGSILPASAQKKDKTLNITVVATTGENLSGQPVSVKQTDYDVAYSNVTLNAEGKATLKAYAGNHTVAVTRDGYEPATTSFNIADGETEKNVSLTLVEKTRKPFAFNAKLNVDPFTGKNSVALTWNTEAPAFFDDFESYDPFTITFGDWTGIDGDHLLQAVDVAVEMNRNRDLGIPVPDYVDENVSDKVVKIIQSYTGVVNKMVWRKY